MGKIHQAPSLIQRVDLRFRMSRTSDEVSENTNNPNDWFTAKFPEQAQQYGPAFMEGTYTDANGLKRFVPACLNEDFFAAILGGDKELGHQVVWYPPEETWYFFDYRVDAFCVTTEEKLKLLLSNYLIRCSQECTSLVDVTNLVVKFRRDDVLQRIVDKAKAVLEADRLFFQGKDGQRRCVDGKYVEPNEEPSYRQFVKRSIVREPEATVTLQDAFHRYFQFCRDHQMQPLTRQEFKGLVAEVIREVFNLGLRHDIPGDEGKHRHGWFGVRLDDGAAFGRN